MTRQARILAFGDSLTWGRIANRPDRHGDDVRWPRVLEKALGGYATVIEEGLNGRRIALEDRCVPIAPAFPCCRCSSSAMRRSTSSS